MNIKQKSFKYIILSILMMFMAFCMLAIKPIDVSAHDGYFLAIAFDTDSKSYIGTIAFQSNSIIGDNHAEVKVSTNLSDIDRDGKKPPYIDYNTMVNNIMSSFKSVMELLKMPYVSEGKTKNGISRKTNKLSNIIIF